VRHLLTYVALGQLRQLKLVVNAGSSCAGPVVDQLAAHLPFDLVRLHQARRPFSAACRPLLRRIAT
jgi:hypothetical protein